MCAAVIGLLATAYIAGCGGGSSVGNGGQDFAPTEVAVAGKSIPMGLAATLTATSQTWGNPAVNFQWAKNGVPISGATEGTYTTPLTTFTDTGSTFTVTISNKLGSVTSAPATLAVTGRAPELGDLRFQQVDAPDTINGNTGGGLFTAFTNELSWNFPHAYGTPMWLGPGVCISPSLLSTDSVPCEWSFSENSYGADVLLTPNVNYQGFAFSNLEAQLNTLAVPNTVVTSLDLEPADDVFGVVWMQTNQGGVFDVTQQTVSLSDLQAAANQEGEHSRVITAVSYNAGKVFYLSYGWQGDTSTLYETQVATAASVDDAPSLAANLAAQGYIVTAMGVGSNGANGVVLVGTRVEGDSVARPFTTDATDCFTNGYAVVGLVAADAANSSAGYICER
jgi:hypothetical protein